MSKGNNEALLERLQISSSLREADNAVERFHLLLLTAQNENEGLKKKVSELEIEAEEAKKQIAELKKELVK